MTFQPWSLTEVAAALALAVVIAVAWLMVRHHEAVLRRERAGRAAGSQPAE